MQRKDTQKETKNLRHPCRCPICCILPPYVTDRVILNGTPTQREWALETKSVRAVSGQA
ncbi:hypothetical protein [Phormidesmis sp. 146-33]